jgi:hypothetical protein
MNLTKKNRTDAIRNILKDCFSKEETDLVAEFRTRVKASARNAAPEFYEIAEKHGTEHLRYRTYVNLLDGEGWRLFRLDSTQDYLSVGGLFPYGPEVRLTSEECAQWESLEKRYASAKVVLTDVFGGYKTVAKLLADFPEYAKYFPATPEKKQLPAVVVGATRKSLVDAGLLSEGETK